MIGRIITVSNLSVKVLLQNPKEISVKDILYANYNNHYYGNSYNKKY